MQGKQVTCILQTLLLLSATLEWRAGCAERCMSGSGRRGREIVRLRPVSHSCGPQNLHQLRTRGSWVQVLPGAPDNQILSQSCATGFFLLRDLCATTYPPQRIAVTHTRRAKQCMFQGAPGSDSPA